MRIAGAHVVFHRLLHTYMQRSLCAILLCKRTQDAPMHPGYWCLIGGKREAAEQPGKTAVREIREELGLVLREAELKPLCDVRIQRGGARGALGVRYFSAALNVDMDALTLRRNPDENKVEGDGLGWFTAEEINHLMVRPEDRTAIGTFFRRHGT